MEEVGYSVGGTDRVRCLYRQGSGACTPSRPPLSSLVFGPP